MKSSNSISQILLFIKLGCVLTGCSESKLRLEHIDDFSISRKFGRLTIMTKNKFNLNKDTISLQLLGGNLDTKYNSDSNNGSYLSVVKSEYVEGQNLNGALLILKGLNSNNNILLSSEDKWIFQKLDSELMLFSKKSHKNTGRKCVILSNSSFSQYEDISNNYCVKKIKP